MTSRSYRFPAFMREQRARKGWSVAHTARVLHHSPTWVLNCEAGNIVTPKDTTQREIALGFGIPLSLVREALGLDPIDDPETDLLNTTLDQLADVLRNADRARYPAIVEAARVVASAP